MDKIVNTIATDIQRKEKMLTRAERQLASSLLSNYPISALGTITTLADAAYVSTPTVARFVQKLGFSGFPDFQGAIKQEMIANIDMPTDVPDQWIKDAPDGHIINRFADRFVENLRLTLSETDIEHYECAVDLIADLERTLFFVGSANATAMADQFHCKLRSIRENLILMGSNTQSWSHALLDIYEGDVVIIFDVRRYENNALTLAEIAKEKGANIILFTDEWRSPVAQHATAMFPVKTSSVSSSMSLATMTVLLETIASDVQERLWSTAQSRRKELETIFDRAGTHRKFNGSF